MLLYLWYSISMVFRDENRREVVLVKYVYEDRKRAFRVGIRCTHPLLDHRYSSRDSLRSDSADEAEASSSIRSVPWAFVPVLPARLLCQEAFGDIPARPRLLICHKS